MPVTALWRRLTGRLHGRILPRHRRKSFYESQEVMKQAALRPGMAVDMSRFTASELRDIELTEQLSLRGRAASAELEARDKRKKHES